MLFASDFSSSVEKWFVSLSGVHLCVLALQRDKSALLSFSSFKHLPHLNGRPVFHRDITLTLERHTGKTSVWSSYARKQPGGPGWHQGEHEPTVRSCDKG